MLFLFAACGFVCILYSTVYSGRYVHRKRFCTYPLYYTAPPYNRRNPLHQRLFLSGLFLLGLCTDTGLMLSEFSILLIALTHSWRQPNISSLIWEGFDYLGSLMSAVSFCGNGSLTPHELGSCKLYWLNEALSIRNKKDYADHLLDGIYHGTINSKEIHKKGFPESH
mgnify:CR=1 FL=1